MHATVRTLFALALTLGSPLFAEQRRDARGDPAARRVEGDITLSGCTPRASEIVVGLSRLRPASAAGRALRDRDLRREDDDGDDDDDQLRMRRAEIHRTADPHVFHFQFDGLRLQRVYQLLPDVSAAACGRVRWREQTRRGLVAAGMGEAVHLEAIAFRSHLELLAKRGEAQTWVGADFVDLSDTTAETRFRWRSEAPGAALGELQISPDPFPLPARTFFDPNTDQHPGAPGCEQPPALIASIPLQRSPDGWATAAVKLGGLLAACNPDGEQLCQTSAVTPGMRKLILSGAPIYARVVPRDSQGAQLCRLRENGASAWTIIASPVAKLKGPPPVELQQTPLLITASYTPPVPEHIFSLNNASVVTYGYRVTQDHYLSPLSSFLQDPLGTTAVWEGVARQGDTLPVGMLFALSFGRGGGSWLDSVADWITGAVDDIGWLVNKVSELYNELKAKVVEFVADAIQAVGVPCDTACHELIVAAIDTGLAAMGLPPSLPDFDQLVDEGKDYLVKEFEEETGVPDEVVQASIEIVGKVIENAKASSTGGSTTGYDWLVYDDGFRPARLTLTVANNPGFKLYAPNHLRIDAGPAYQQADVEVPGRYLSGPGVPVTVPVTLFANYKLLAGLADLNDPQNANFLEFAWNNVWFSSPGCHGLTVDSSYYTPPPMGSGFNLPVGPVMQTNYEHTQPGDLRAFGLNCH